MYEIVYRTGDVILVLQTVEGIEAASWHTSYYRQQGIPAFYRPILSKVA